MHELQLPPRSFRHHFGLADKVGNVVPSSCVASGIDRLAVALFCIHSVDMTRCARPLCAARWRLECPSIRARNGSSTACGAESAERRITLRRQASRSACRAHGLCRHPSSPSSTSRSDRSEREEGELRVRIYSPQRGPGQSVPSLIYFHGGGSSRARSTPMTASVDRSPMRAGAGSSRSITGWRRSSRSRQASRMAGPSRVSVAAHAESVGMDSEASRRRGRFHRARRWPPS